MKCKQELEYLAMVVQDYIAKQDRSVQIALAERAQHCVNTIEQALQATTGTEPEVTTGP